MSNQTNDMSETKMLESNNTKKGEQLKEISKSFLVPSNEKELSD